MESGIYVIINVINDKKYIGQSNDIPRRWIEHRTLLNNNKHGNTYLQASWNKYGAKSFVFRVLQYCTTDKLNQLEIAYIKHFDSYRNGYNGTLGGSGIIKDRDIMVQQGKINARKGWDDPEHIIRVKATLKDNGHYSSVMCNETGEVFESIREAERVTGIDSRTISYCCRGKRPNAGRVLDGHARNLGNAGRTLGVPATWKYI